MLLNHHQLPYEQNIINMIVSLIWKVWKTYFRNRNFRDQKYAQILSDLLLWPNVNRLIPVIFNQNHDHLIPSLHTLILILNYRYTYHSHECVTLNVKVKMYLFSIIMNWHIYLFILFKVYCLQSEVPS